MAQTASHAGRQPFLPPDLRDFLRRRAVEVAGTLLGAAAAAFFLALMSASPHDPSFNTAADGPAGNLLGSFGALVADLALQTLGLASIAVALIGAAWSLRLVRHRGIRHWGLRLGLLPPLLLLGAVALATLPRPEDWPFAPGLGGFLGALLAGWLGDGLALAGLDPVPGGLIGLAGGLLALGLLVFVMGLPWSDYQRAGRTIAVAVAFLARHGMALHERWAERRRARPRVFDVRRLRDFPPEEDLAAEEIEDAMAVEPAARTRRPAGRAEPSIEMPRIVEPPRPARARPGRRAASGQRTLDLLPAEYALPPLDFLQEPTGLGAAQRINEESLEKNARLLESVLGDFGVRGEIVKVRPGPVVTLYELEPAPGTKTSRVVGLADDVARSMSAVSVRIAVVPGRSVIGIELPNRQRETVFLRELLSSEAYERTTAKLALVLGKDIGGTPVIVDLARMPHLLIAGTTGSGKSVAINTMIMSLIYRLPPDRCKFIMIDPKMLELSVYDGIPHLLSPVVTDPRKAIVALKWTVREMEDRYRMMSKLGVRNIEGYNARIAQAKAAREVLTRRVQTGFDQETGEPIYEEEPIELKPLPFIVVIVDEMADLMLVAGKDIEAAIQRLAQMARAAGIHIIMATQRPSVDVITGTIKANFPSRISFHVTSKIDSRTILGEMGAEQLLGQGDMLYMAHGGRIARVHGPFVGDIEVEHVVQFLKQQGEPTYIDDVTREDDDPMAEFLGEPSGNGADELYDRAVAIVCRERKASTSFIQRHLQVGYNRAARIMERMEKEGVVGPANHVGKREVLARNIEERE